MVVHAHQCQTSATRRSNFCRQLSPTEWHLIYRSWNMTGTSAIIYFRYNYSRRLYSITMNRTNTVTIFNMWTTDPQRNLHVFVPDVITLFGLLPSGRSREILESGSMVRQLGPASSILSRALNVDSLLYPR